MNITRHTSGEGGVRLALHGELELATVDRLHQHVRRELAADRPPRRLVVDLAEVTFCDSTGLGALIEARAAAADRGVCFLAINPSGMTRKIMEVTGLLDMLTTNAGS